MIFFFYCLLQLMLLGGGGLVCCRQGGQLFRHLADTASGGGGGRVFDWYLCVHFCHCRCAATAAVVGQTLARLPNMRRRRKINVVQHLLGCHKCFGAFSSTALFCQLLSCELTTTPMWGEDNKFHFAPEIPFVVGTLAACTDGSAALEAV